MFESNYNVYAISALHLKRSQNCFSISGQLASNLRFRVFDRRTSDSSPASLHCTSFHFCCSAAVFVIFCPVRMLASSAHTPHCTPRLPLRIVSSANMQCVCVCVHDEKWAKVLRVVVRVSNHLMFLRFCAEFHLNAELITAFPFRSRRSHQKVSLRSIKVLCYALWKNAHKLQVSRAGRNCWHFEAPSASLRVIGAHFTSVPCRLCQIIRATQINWARQKAISRGLLAKRWEPVLLTDHK